MYKVLSTTLSDKTKKTWRAELKGWAPEHLHEAIDLGVADYLFCCTSVDEAELDRAINSQKL